MPVSVCRHGKPRMGSTVFVGRRRRAPPGLVRPVGWRSVGRGGRVGRGLRGALGYGAGGAGGVAVHGQLDGGGSGCEESGNRGDGHRRAPAGDVAKPWLARRRRRTRWGVADGGRHPLGRAGRGDVSARAPPSGDRECGTTPGEQSRGQHRARPFVQAGQHGVGAGAAAAEGHVPVEVVTGVCAPAAGCRFQQGAETMAVLVLGPFCVATQVGLTKVFEGTASEVGDRVGVDTQRPAGRKIVVPLHDGVPQDGLGAPGQPVEGPGEGADTFRGGFGRRSAG